MKRLFAWIVTVCMLVNLAGCCFCIPDLSEIIPGGVIDNPLKPPVDYSEPAETEPLASEPPEIQLPFEYTLTQEDVDHFYALLEESEKIALVSTDYDQVDAITEEVNDAYDVLQDQCMIAQLIYYCNLSDEAASQRYLDCVDICTAAHDAYMVMVRNIYLSDAPCKAQLFEDWTQKELDMLMAYTEEIAQLEKRNSELLVQYRALEDPSSDEMVPLYIEFVQNNNRIARIYGYENYYVYSYELRYERDYGEKELNQMRRYVARHLAPIYENAYHAFADTYQNLDYDDQLLVSNFMSEPYETNDQPYFMNYLDTLPESMRENMLLGLDEEHCYFTDYPEAYEGAFTTTIGETSFCYFGPGYQNAMTVCHELGHFYGSQFGDISDMPLDLAETQSQGNEWLFLGQLAEQMDPEAYEAMVNYKMFNDLCTILICVLVDEFEQRVYSEPDIASFTASDLNRIMEDVCRNYGGLDYVSYWVTDVQSYWRMVVMESPVYYISYAVSAIAAINLFTIYLQDPALAVETYRGLIEIEEEEVGFLETISAAGLPGPFDESAYRDLARIYQ